jgi:hypothetical protein
MFDSDKRVPLRVGWLSENGLLVKAAALLGYKLELIDGKLQGANEKGAPATSDTVGPVFLYWDDNMLFTLGQLFALGFTIGDGTEMWHSMNDI